MCAVLYLETKEYCIKNSLVTPKSKVLVGGWRNKRKMQCCINNGSKETIREGKLKIKKSAQVKIAGKLKKSFCKELY